MAIFSLGDGFDGMSNGWREKRDDVDGAVV